MANEKKIRSKQRSLSAAGEGDGKRERRDDPMKSDKRKQSLYFPEEMLEEIKREANRQDRSLSWIVQRAWTIARDEIRKFPSVNDDFGTD